MLFEVGTRVQLADPLVKELKLRVRQWVQGLENDLLVVQVIARAQVIGEIYDPVKSEKINF